MSWTPRTLGLAGIGGVLVIGLLYVSFRNEPVPVDLHEIVAGPMQVTIDADAKTQIRDLFEVAAPISGTALRSPVEVGDPVKANETIVAVVRPVEPGLLDTRSRVQAEAAIREAEAARHVAETDLRKAYEDRILAQTQYDRTKTLVERGVVSVTRLEESAQRLAVANATHEAAQARIEMAVSSLERNQAALIDPNFQGAVQNGCCVEIRAPSDGVVLSIGTISERPVTAGTALLSIGDPGNIELVADLLSSDAVRLAPGTTARVERWGGPRPLEAVLDRVEPSARTKVSALGIEEQRVDAIFILTSPADERRNLGDGFSAFMRIVEWHADNARQVPLSALFKRGEEWAVFVAKAGIVSEHHVKVGMRNTRFAEILSGLAVGDLVVAHPNDDLSAGDSVVDRQKL